MSYSDLEYEIFSRQFILKNFSENNIEKLEHFKVCIIGVGGIGCPLTQYLISSGLKNITLFDGDRIEKTNLGRQILYSIDDVGKFKSVTAKKRLLKTNPNSEITAYSEDLTTDNINSLLRYDIVIDTSDSWYTSKLINKFCTHNSLKFIFSSAVNYNIQICLFKNTGNHICLNCLFPNDEDIEQARCETVGISSVCAGIAGLITAQKTINTILDIKDESNLLTLINTENLSINNIILKNNKDCVLNNS
ncbi:ThiF family adenylyltransferase [Pelagibacterales bacterium SAG-MED31]|nr:ThiF family adenylyltransferase [Pelagibacterales bacterium SAG-MED31]